jgi:putative transposase
MLTAPETLLEQPATRRLQPGTRITWFGQRVQIGRIGASRIELLGPDGTVLGAPLASEVYAAAQQPGSNPHLWMDVDPLELLADDKDALDDYKAKYEIVHRALTGRKTTDEPGTPFQPGMDPSRYDRNERKKALAELLSREEREGGVRKGERVKPDSERRRIERILQRWEAYGPLGLVHQNRLRVHDPNDFAVREAINGFLDAAKFGSKITAMAAARKFKAWAQDKKPDLKLPQNKQLAQYVSDWRNNRDHSGGSSKTQISAEHRPDMSPVLRTVTRVGEVVLFDTTKTNVWVRNPKGGKFVRLELTIAMDLFSRAIVGMALTHTTPSVAVALCLADVLTPRSGEALEEWEGESPTPYAGCFDEMEFLERIRDPDARGFLPETIHTDNGSVYVSNSLVALCAYFRISLEQSRAYTPTDKAQIEGWFGDFKKLLEQLLPGFLGGNQYERGESPESEAAMTSVDYELAVRRFIYLYNRREIGDLHPPDDPYESICPLEKWDWSLKKHGSVRMPAFALDPVRLLPWVDLKPDSGRVYCLRLWYRSPVLARLATNPLVTDAEGRVRIYYDPTDMRNVFVFDETGQSHAVPWRDLGPFTPRFGLYFVGLVRGFADTERLSGPQFEDLLVEVASRYGFQEPPSAEERKALSTPEQFLSDALRPLFRRVRERFRVAPPKAAATPRVPRKSQPDPAPQPIDSPPATERPLAVEALPTWDD